MRIDMQRTVLDGVLSPAQCQGLLLLARSLAVLGYRDDVCSATIFEVAAALPSALIPLVAARQAVHAAVEEALGTPLLVEFTGLICWRPGASIAMHHDANRPYLRQRTHSAVCYLQTAGTDFEGGTFQFQSPAALGSGGSSGGGGGGPVDVLAAPGRVVAYDAQQQHGVMRVLAGERCALTLWFTADPQHSEDARLLARMAGAPQRPLPLPASMYRLPDGTDLRLCRLAMAGLALVHAGRLLHSAEDVPEQGDGAGVQLAVQPPALQAWLDWQADAASRGGRAGVQPAAEQQPAAGAALVLGSIRFSSVQEAVLAAQRWCWRRCPGGWSRERVCCAHLCQPPANAQHRHQAHSCAWLRSCQLGSSQLSSNGAAAAELSTQVAAAAAASRKWLDSNGAALAALQPQWLQLGALFLEEDVAAV